MPSLKAAEKKGQKRPAILRPASVAAALLSFVASAYGLPDGGFPAREQTPTEARQRALEALCLPGTISAYSLAGADSIRDIVVESIMDGGWPISPDFAKTQLKDIPLPVLSASAAGGEVFRSSFPVLCLLATGELASAGAQDGESALRQSGLYSEGAFIAEILKLQDPNAHISRAIEVFSADAFSRFSTFRNSIHPDGSPTRQRATKDLSIANRILFHEDAAFFSGYDVLQSRVLRGASRASLRSSTASVIARRTLYVCSVEEAASKRAQAVASGRNWPDSEFLLMMTTSRQAENVIARLISKHLPRRREGLSAILAGASVNASADDESIGNSGLIAAESRLGSHIVTLGPEFDYDKTRSKSSPSGCSEYASSASAQTPHGTPDGLLIEGRSLPWSPNSRSLNRAISGASSVGLPTNSEKTNDPAVSETHFARRGAADEGSYVQMCGAPSAGFLALAPLNIAASVEATSRMIEDSIRFLSVEFVNANIPSVVAASSVAVCDATSSRKEAPTALSYISNQRRGDEIMWISYVAQLKETLRFAANAVARNEMTAKLEAKAMRAFAPTVRQRMIEMDVKKNLEEARTRAGQTPDSRRDR